ncbi:MAG: hypothetical protein WD379_08905 [Dehalococcoidia bacterium]
MDAEWANRGGIIAEAISFLLIAPEIIGIERIFNAEKRLERLLAPAAGSAPVSERYIVGRFLPYLAPDWSKGGWPARLAEFVGIILLTTAITIAISLLWGPLAAVPLIVVIGVSGLMLPLGYAVTLLGGRTARIAGRVLAAPSLPITLATVGSMVASYAVARFVAQLAHKLLAGPDRLRAAVFGTGVLLLFGGMGAQLAATF